MIEKKPKKPGPRRKSKKRPGRPRSKKKKAKKKPGVMGRPRKSIADHKAEGTYRKDRHREALPELLKKPEVKKLPGIRESRRWIRNASDELAIAAGYRFCERLAEYTCKWIERHLVLCQGAWAGQPFSLMPWQSDDLLYPLFGWVRARPDDPFAGKIVRRFQRVFILIAKKNGKSPTAAAVGAHMWAGDGEYGADCACLARDAKQAGIVHRHAREMVRASPDLAARTTIREREHFMFFRDTRSPWSIRSEEQSGGQRSEGDNFHYISYDEVHVARNDDLYRRTRYARRGRTQPMWFGCTTAGESNEGIWYDLKEHGEAVLAGKIVDHAFLPVMFFADEDDDDTDPGTWKKANPSLGYTLSLEELAEDRANCKTDHDKRDFRRYTCNIAPGTVHAWIQDIDWLNCGADYTLDDILDRDRVGYLGLDLGQSGDMCGMVLIVPDWNQEGRFYQWPWCWLPRSVYEDRKDEANYEQWVKAGELTLAGDRTVDKRAIQKTVEALNKRIQIKQIAYDPMFADDLTQRIEEATGIERVVHTQRFSDYALATKTYDDLLRTSGILHPKHGVMSWQAGHCQVKTSPEGMRKPVKRKHGDHRTIDIIQSAVMCLRLAMAYEPVDSWAVAI